MATTNQEANDQRPPMPDMEAMARKYPSVKKFLDAEDDYVESHDGREERLLSFLKQRPNLTGNPKLVLEAIDEFSYNEDFLINIGEHKAGIVCDLISKEKPKVYVELGGYIGYSAILIADHMRKLFADDAQIKVWSLEFDPKIAGIAREIIALAGLQDVNEVVTGKAADSLRTMAKDGSLTNIDLLFIDHAEDQYVADLRVALDELKLLKPGSVIVADNLIRPGVPGYQDFVRNRKDLKSEAVIGLIMPGEMPDEMEISYVL